MVLRLNILVMWSLDRTEEKIFIEEIYPCTGTADKLQEIVNEGQN